jgi:hypothetical protein
VSPVKAEIVLFIKANPDPITDPNVVPTLSGAQNYMPKSPMPMYTTAALNSDSDDNATVIMSLTMLTWKVNCSSLMIQTQSMRLMIMRRYRAVTTCHWAATRAQQAFCLCTRISEYIPV